jgi:hypothetical protein
MADPSVATNLGWTHGSVNRSRTGDPGNGINGYQTAREASAMRAGR